MHWLRNTEIGTISQVLDTIGSFLVLPALALLVTADVILRYGFNAPLSWGLEASSHLLLLFFLLGLVQSFRVGDHTSTSWRGWRPRCRWDGFSVECFR